MPELPEVEVVVRQLNQCRRLFESPISQVKLFKPNRWIGITLEEIPQKIVGRTIQTIHRRAKFIVMTFENESQLIIHLRMTGRLLSQDCQEEEAKHVREVFFFENGSQLIFNDSRTLGRLYFQTPQQELPEIKKLGVEPLTLAFNVEKLSMLLKSCHLEIKDFLLDQTKIAGIGNIYAAEILFACKIHPQRRTHEITADEIDCLASAIPQILLKAINFNGTTVSDFRDSENHSGEFQKLLKVYGRAGESCQTCGTAIKRIVQKQRSSYFCSGCQK